MFIPGGSKVTFKVSNSFVSEAVSPQDAEIESDSIVSIDGMLACTAMIDPVKKVAENEFVVTCCWQDAIIVYKGHVFDSTSKMD